MNDDFAEFMKAQTHQMELDKYYEGIRINADPGEQFLKNWVTNGSAEAFRKWWDENKKKEEQ